MDSHEGKKVSQVYPKETFMSTHQKIYSQIKRLTQAVKSQARQNRLIIDSKQLIYKGLLSSESSCVSQYKLTHATVILLEGRAHPFTNEMESQDFKGLRTNQGKFKPFTIKMKSRDIDTKVYEHIRACLSLSKWTHGISIQRLMSRSEFTRIARKMN